MQPKIFKIIAPVLLLILAAFLIFFFNADLKILLGLQTAPVPQKDFRGENITFNVGNKSVSIPPKFSQDALDTIKKEMTEKGGLPLKIERKGNPLPFGIP